MKFPALNPWHLKVCSPYIFWSCMRGNIKCDMTLLGLNCWGNHARFLQMNPQMCLDIPSKNKCENRFWSIKTITTILLLNGSIPDVFTCSNYSPPMLQFDIQFTAHAAFPCMTWAWTNKTIQHQLYDRNIDYIYILHIVHIYIVHYIYKKTVYIIKHNIILCNRGI